MYVFFNPLLACTAMTIIICLFVWPWCTSLVPPYQHDNLNFWLVNFAKNALFKSSGVILSNWHSHTCTCTELSHGHTLQPQSYITHWNVYASMWCQHPEYIVCVRLEYFTLKSRGVARVFNITQWDMLAIYLFKWCLHGNWAKDLYTASWIMIVTVTIAEIQQLKDNRSIACYYFQSK